MNLLKTVDFTDNKNIALTEQNTLRILVGFLGVFLPVLLYLFLFIDSGYRKPLESISHYYFTRVSGIFVVTLSLLSIFLIIYKGKKPIDFIVSVIAGVFAFFVVLFPTNNIDAGSESSVCAVTFLRDAELRIAFHYISAAIFLLSLAFMALFIFTKSDKPPELRTTQKKIRNGIYRVCGIVIVVALAIAFLGHKNILHLPMFGDSLTFWMETFAVESFGFAWLVKAEVFLKDRPQT